MITMKEMLSACRQAVVLGKPGGARQIRSGGGGKTVKKHRLTGQSWLANSVLCFAQSMEYRRGTFSRR